MNYTAESFKNLALETKASTSVLEDVEVTMNPSMFEDYAKAYWREMQRVNPLKAQNVDITEQQLEKYFQTLLAIRIKSTELGGYKDWRTAKRLCIPAWIQFSLSTVGIVTDHLYGCKFKPTYDFEIDLDWALSVSEVVDSFSEDGLAASKDAFPRTPEGDKDVMSYIVIDNYVKGRREDLAPIAAYVAAFLGLKLKQEQEFKLLYKVTYEDVNFIRYQVAHERSLICLSSNS